MAKGLSEKQMSQELQKLMNKWRTRLFLQEWGFEHAYVSGASTQDGNDFDIAADIAVTFDYKTARIRTYDLFWQSPPEKREAMFVHELRHCHTQGVWDLMKGFLNGYFTTPQDIHSAIETLTQRISVIAIDAQKK